MLNLFKRLITPNKILILILIVGFGLRYYHLLETPFHGDEARIAIDARNFSSFSISEFSVWPPIYLLLLKLWGSVCSFSESSLRLLSVLVGTLVIYFAYQLVRFVTNNQSTSLIGALYFALNPQLIYYSRTVKPYILDALIAIVLYYLGFQFIKKLGDTKIAVTFALFSFFGFLAGFVSIFVTSAVLIVILAKLAPQLKKQSFLRQPTIISLAIISVSLLTYYYFMLRHQLELPLALRSVEWWMNEKAFPYIPLSFSNTSSWVLERLFLLTTTFANLNLVFAGIIIMLTITGILHYVDKYDRHQLAVILISPVIMFILSLGYLFPFIGYGNSFYGVRLATFLVPGFLLLIIMGFSKFLDSFRSANINYVYKGTIVLLPIMIFLINPQQIWFPDNSGYSDLREIKGFIQENLQEGDHIYSTTVHSLHLDYYFYSLSDSLITYSVDSPQRSDFVRKDINTQFVQGDRVWVILHNHKIDSKYYDDFINQAFARKGTRLLTSPTYKNVNTYVKLYQIK